MARTSSLSYHLLISHQPVFRYSQVVKTPDFDSVIEGSNPSTEANISLSYHFFIILNDENTGSNPVTRLTFQSGKGKLWALRIQSAGSFVLDECALVSTTTRQNFFTSGND